MTETVENVLCLISGTMLGYVLHELQAVIRKNLMLRQIARTNVPMTEEQLRQLGQLNEPHYRAREPSDTTKH